MRKLLFVLPFAAMFFGSCLPSNSNDTPNQITVPTGIFTGQFRKIHKNMTSGKMDTMKANFRMTMSTDSGYKVTADTTTIHAGSKGAFQVTTGFIYFVDSTYPKTGTPVKTHLAGTYAYVFDGSVFKMANPTSSVDSIFYQYDLKKQ
ncbi:hypothetical protein [Mucilaginibacter ginkgonis]|uniref:Lipoprotein n=1 Tax=Mucilaginibacter ginkgonis TaxID=2682091 RepID=A0A6I4I389_9SPHI|nr:hypothetical protein [Mucilaginibacter ginkgonis]QQL48433.1 hypothetical protein GO620_009530 [Mucilaginibacter ginkgonis]